MAGTASDAGDKARLNAFYMVNLALEAFFASEHQGANQRRPDSAEFAQNSCVYPIFALAATLPTEVVFLARAHMLAEFAPTGKRNSNSCQMAADEFAENPPPHTVSRILLDAAKTRPLQRKAFDNANIASDAVSGEFVRDFKVKDGGNMCWHLEQEMLDVLWYAADAEPAFRIMDLQFVLPPKRAKLVAEAAVAAFADVYDAHLRSLKPRPADELASYACAVIGANVKQSNIVVTDLFSPADVSGWFDTMLRLLAVLESRGGPRSKKGQPSFQMATRRN